jgi:putative hemolysin
MLPRIDVITIAHNASQEEIRRILAENPYSRYPVHKGTTHLDIIGVLQAKDMLNYVLSGKELDINDVMVQVATFPEVTPTIKVIEHLRTVPVHMAILVDEHGSFVGIVTLTDLVEVITGELYQHGGGGLEITKREDGSWLIDAGILVELVFAEIGMTSAHKSSSYHTLAGFVLHQLSYIPKAGDKFEYNGFQFEVVDMDGNRIDKVLVI